VLPYEIDRPLRELIRKVGPEAATRSYQLCRDAIGKVGRLATRFNIKCGFEYKPSLFPARYQREVTDFREEYKLRRAMGLDLEFLEEADVRRAFPSPGLPRCNAHIFRFGRLDH
jgi:hypothetical protein